MSGKQKDNLSRSPSSSSSDIEDESPRNSKILTKESPKNLIPDEKKSSRNGKPPSKPRKPPMSENQRKGFESYKKRIKRGIKAWLFDDKGLLIENNTIHNFVLHPNPRSDTHESFVTEEFLKKRDFDMLKFLNAEAVKLGYFTKLTTKNVDDKLYSSDKKIHKDLDIKQVLKLDVSISKEDELNLLAKKSNIVNTINSTDSSIAATSIVQDKIKNSQEDHQKAIQTDINMSIIPERVNNILTKDKDVHNITDESHHELCKDSTPEKNADENHAKKENCDTKREMPHELTGELNVRELYKKMIDRNDLLIKNMHDLNDKFIKRTKRLSNKIYQLEYKMYKSKPYGTFEKVKMLHTFLSDKIKGLSINKIFCN